MLAPVLSVMRPWAKGFVRLDDAAPRHADVEDLAKNRSPIYPWLDWSLATCLRASASRKPVDAGRNILAAIAAKPKNAPVSIRRGP